MADAYALPLSDPARAKTAAGWLYLGLAALVVAGIFTILLVLARTPGMAEHIPFVDFFHTALVVHVDLSVLVWFLAFGGMLAAIALPHAGPAGRIALVLAAVGALCLSLSPFWGQPEPLMNNYVPVLRSPLFFAGLALFAGGFAVQAVASALSYRLPGSWLDGAAVLRFGVFTALFAALAAFAAWGWSYVATPRDLAPEPYYEILFWGSGHILQFAHTQFLLVVWLWLATASDLPPRPPHRATLLFLALGFLPVLGAPLLFVFHPIESVESRLAFTDLMRYGNGLSSVPVGVAILLSLITRPAATPEARAYRANLFWSVLLFFSGGVIGFLISGTNVTIPAHYHGSIVGVTLAYMGLACLLLPRLGHGTPPARGILWQARLYGIGQLMHVSGLAWSGGYGVQRKTPGAAQGLDLLEKKLGMGLMGLGGLLAILGGILFLVMAFRAIAQGRAPLPPESSSHAKG